MPFPTPLDPALDAFIAAMPKVELHLHLEGSVQPRTLCALADRHGVHLPATVLAGPNRYAAFRTFDAFLDCYLVVCACLRTPDDFARVAVDLGQEAHRQHIRYLEVHVNPEPHVRKRQISFPDLLTGLSEGRAAVREQWGVELRWIFDGVRDAESGPGSVTRTVAWLGELAGDVGVIGLGLGGNEIGHPAAPFAADFAAARAAGFHVVAHAGETTGPETIWETIETLGIERIGHGITAGRDPALIDRLRQMGMPLEICPTSNLRTGVVASAAAHPFRRLDDAGVLVTVNSDDPPMFGTTLTDEYRFLARQFGYGVDDIARLNLNAVAASFLPEFEKIRLRDEFQMEMDRLRKDLGISWGASPNT